MSLSTDSEQQKDVLEDESSSNHRTLWMGAIQPSWDESFLYNLFAPSYSVASVKVMRSATGHLGYAFLEFQTPEAARYVLEAFNGSVIPGTQFPFRLNWSCRTQSNRDMVHNGDVSSLFVGDLSNEVDDRTLLTAFKEKFPSCFEAKIIHDSYTGNSKGYGFVRFESKNECSQAVQTMNGAVVGGRAIRVGLATERKSENFGFSYSKSPLSMSPPSSPGSPTNVTTVFVGQLDQQVTVDDLYRVFAPYGNIENIKIPPGKYCGFVKFSTHEQADKAILGLDGIKIGRNNVRLAWGKAANSYVSSVPMVYPFVQLAPQNSYMYFQPSTPYYGQYYNYGMPPPPQQGFTMMPGAPPQMQIDMPMYETNENRRFNGSPTNSGTEYSQVPQSKVNGLFGQQQSIKQEK